MANNLRHRYKEISLKFYTILLTHADEVEAVSVDEAMIDVTRAVRDKIKNSTGVQDEAKEFAEKLRKEVQAETGCESKSALHLHTSLEFDVYRQYLSQYRHLSEHAVGAASYSTC